MRTFRNYSPNTIGMFYSDFYKEIRDKRVFIYFRKKEIKGFLKHILNGERSYVVYLGDLVVHKKQQ